MAGGWRSMSISVVAQYDTTQEETQSDTAQKETQCDTAQEETQCDTAQEETQCDTAQEETQCDTAQEETLLSYYLWLNATICLWLFFLYSYVDVSIPFGSTLLLRLSSLCITMSHS